jgi:TetR/AcrR family transcriptional regulator, transcriptional repressor for nem operon
VSRTKEFDPDVALRRAMELFWLKGYEATSISDLVEHLGIGRASIYATFGDKHALYMKALDRYIENGTGFVGLPSQLGPALPAVRELVERYARESAEDKLHQGCFVVNSAVELAPHDEAVARRVETNWDLIETALSSALTRAKAQGELSADADPRALARFLLTVMQGMRVIGKGCEDPARLRDTARLALSVLS